MTHVVDPLISVIVPVYKVEPYLRKCIDSIRNQTYRKLEIILVDDGSPDRCGEICDEYAADDQRIQVIHKTNGGLSSARNAGIDVSQGDYLGFVDSDDWIEPDMYEELLRTAVACSADIAVCGRIEEYNGKSTTYAWENMILLDRAGAIEALLKGAVMQSYAWNKLWKRELFCEVRFPEGRNYEDIAVIHKVYEQAQTVVCIPKAKYHYLQRQDSIVRNPSLHKRVEYWLSAKQRFDDMSEMWPKHIPLLQAHCAMAVVNVWNVCFVNSVEERKRMLPQLKEMSAFVKEHLSEVQKEVTFGITGRITLWLAQYPTKMSFFFAYFLNCISRWKHGKPF